MQFAAEETFTVFDRETSVHEGIREKSKRLCVAVLATK